MVYLTVMYQTDRDGMMLRTRAHHVAAAHERRVTLDCVEVDRTVHISGVDALPALMVDDKVVAEGRVPKLSEIEGFVSAALAEESELAKHGAKKEIWRADPKAMPHCGGCGRDCRLDEPECGVGVERAAKLGIPRAQ
jgi:hypothetical protein